ncbi:hypothetical protein ACFL6I_09540 [candidate division KSB1 bacterium]
MARNDTLKEKLGQRCRSSRGETKTSLSSVEDAVEGAEATETKNLIYPQDRFREEVRQYIAERKMYDIPSLVKDHKDLTKQPYKEYVDWRLRIAHGMLNAAKRDGKLNLLEAHALDNVRDELKGIRQRYCYSSNGHPSPVTEDSHKKSVHKTLSGVCGRTDCNYNVHDK